MRIVLDLQGCQTESRFRGIGRYTLSLAQAIVRQGGEHDIWLALNGCFPNTIQSIRHTFDTLLPADRVVVYDLPGPIAQANSENHWRAQAAEYIRECFLANLKPDILHVSSLFEGLVDDAATSVGKFESNINTAVTLYDLIPLKHPESYLHTPAYQDWYYRKLYALNRAQLLLAISGYTRQEAITALQQPEDRIVNISTAVDDRFRPLQLNPKHKEALCRRHRLKRPYILYTGGVDARKNLARLIEAFALLPNYLRSNHQLVLVGKAPESDIKRLLLLGKKLGLSDEDLVFTGYVPDDDLVLLHNCSELFVFPSLHEGFGLPALEAMACGAAVIGANATSLREVIGIEEAMFDPSNSQEISKKIHQALTDADLLSHLRQHGLRQATKFSWKESARKVLDVFTELHTRDNAPFQRPSIGHIENGRLRLAFISLLSSPTNTNFDQHVELLQELACFYDIDLVVNQFKVDDPWVKANLAIHSVEWFEQHAHEFDRILYKIDYSSAFQEIIKLVEQHPGVVGIEDILPIDNFPGPESKDSATFIFLRVLYALHGYAALSVYQMEGHKKAATQYSFIEFILPRTIGAFFHSTEALQGVKRLVDIEIPKNPFNTTRVFEQSESTIRPAAGDGPDCSLPNGVIAERGVENQQLNNRGVSPGEFYHSSIESFYANHPIARERRITKAIAMISSHASPSDNDIVNAAISIAANQPRPGQPQLMVDISELACRDAKTGIQRVVRSILEELLLRPPEDYRVEPVYCMNGKYFYARHFTLKMLGLDVFDFKDTIVESKPGDIFLGLDLFAHGVTECEPFYTHMRNRGVKILFVVYDLLAVLHPQFFDPNMPIIFNKWLQSITKIGDGLICISRAVADELSAWLDSAQPERFRPLQIGYFHLGADIETSLPTKGLIQDGEDILQNIQTGTAFLMVGTLEPRKGHRQALDAFEKLWRNGLKPILVIVGKHGWHVEDLAKRLRNHPELGKRLYWLESASDEVLLKIYESVSALLAASIGEGFGLPLIEAARGNLPIIARDIPVFREIAGEYAFYFRGESGEDLAVAIEQWLELFKDDRIPSSSGMPYLTWRQSATQLADIMFNSNWHSKWKVGEKYIFTPVHGSVKTEVGLRNAGQIVTNRKTGFLTYGPYAALPRGAYLLKIFGNIQLSHPGDAWLDVVYEAATSTLLKMELPVEPEQRDGLIAEIHFFLDQDVKDIEIRLHVLSTTHGVFEKYELIPLTDNYNTSNPIDVSDCALQAVSKGECCKT